jgi:thiol-disulfide isomerase/thioredoxin
MNRTILLVLPAVLLLVFGCTASNPSTPGSAGSTDPAASELKPAPQFELDNVAGGKFTSSDIKGKVTIVDFWATWCAPCIEEIPNYNEIAAKYADKGVILLGVTLESGSLEEVKPKVAELNMQYPVVMGNDEMVAGFGGLLGFPTTFVVTADGQIYQKYLGYRPKKKELLEKDIETLISQSENKVTKAVY